MHEPGDTRRSAASTGARGAYVALAVGLAVVTTFAVVIDTAAGSWVYLAGGAYCTALSVVGACHMPRTRRRIWVAFAVSQAVYLAGDVLHTVDNRILHRDPFPSLADVAYLATYPVFALGIVWLVRGRRRGHDRAAFLDAAILTTGVIVVGSVFLVGPAALAGGTSLLSQGVAAAYPAGDLLLLAVAFRLLTAGTVRNVALWAILGSVEWLLAGDLGELWASLRGVPYPGWVDVGYLVSYLLLGFASLHPSAPELSAPAPERPERITVARVSLLGVALVLVPATDQLARLTGAEDMAWLIFGGGCVAAVLVVMRLWDLVRDLQRQAVQLAALARKDGLTGIANRRTWDHELSRACAFARESGAPLTVALLDLDHFKNFNDTRGHTAGDLVLKETATAWASIVGERGFLARYGGEEFTVLLPQLDAAQAQPVLERLRQAVTHGQTCSIGAATWDGVESPAHLMGRTDEALYHAKRSGRDRVAVHEDGLAIVMPALSYQNPALATLRTVYQPIVDLNTGERVGTEALSRFEGQDPRTVFDNAGRDGSAAALEAGAITSALAGWDGTGLLALNLSLSTLLSRPVQEALRGDLTGLVIEITEADLVDYTPEVMLALQSVRSRGALVAIDDFGAGFSNTHRVAKIGPDIVKIDMSLVRGIDHDPMLQAVVLGCLKYAELTGTRMIAEGIETQGELDCLVRLGIPLGQGYLLGAPGALDAGALSPS